MNLALVVENRFNENEFVTQVDESTFAWFKNSKFGENNMLSVVMQVKDENGKKYKGELPPLKFSAELLYEDDSPVPLHPLNPLNNKQKQNPMMTFRKMKGEPRYSLNNKPVRFWFRIEEVIFHHSSHKGFKLNICAKAKDHTHKCIHSFPMKEVIVVLSKPRSNATKQTTETIEPPLKRKREENEDPFSLPQNQIMIEDDDLSEEFFDLIDVNSPESIAKDTFAVIPVSALIDSYRCLDMCFCCDKTIAIDSFLLPKLHTKRCLFANEVLPLLQLMGVNTDSLSFKKNKDINNSVSLTSRSKNASTSDNIHQHTSIDEDDINQHFTDESEIHVSTAKDSKASCISYNGDNITYGNITTLTPIQSMNKQQMMYHLNKAEEPILNQTRTPLQIANVHVASYQYPFDARGQNTWPSFNNTPFAGNQHYNIRSEQHTMSDLYAQPFTSIISSSQTQQHRFTPKTKKKAYDPSTSNQSQTRFLWQETFHGRSFIELERRSDNINTSVQPRRASLGNNMNEDVKLSPIAFSNVERLKRDLLELEEK